MPARQQKTHTQHTHARILYILALPYFSVSVHDNAFTLLVVNYYDTQTHSNHFVPVAETPHCNNSHRARATKYKIGRPSSMGFFSLPLFKNDFCLFDSHGQFTFSREKKIGSNLLLVCAGCCRLFGCSACACVTTKPWTLT